MKTNNSRSRNPAGFTLVELLAVIAIIGILGGMSFGAFNHFQKKAAVDKAQVQMQAIAAAIEDFRSDYGSVPVKELKLVNGATLPDKTGDGAEESTKGLLEALYPQSDDLKIYLADLDPEGAKSASSAFTASTNSGITDPFGMPYRYRSDGSNAQKNPDFDLISLGPDGRFNTPDDIILR